MQPFILLKYVKICHNIFKRIWCLSQRIIRSPKLGDILADNLKERMTTSQQINTNITSGNPTLVEHDKPTDLKVVDVNGTRGLEVSHTGQGVVQGINFSANGTVVIVPKSEGGC